MTTSESHGAISGSRVSAERLAEMLAEIPLNPDGSPWTVGLGTKVPTDDLHSILTELQSLRSEPSEPVAWHVSARFHSGTGVTSWCHSAKEADDALTRYQLNPNIEHSEIVPLYASPQPGASS